MSVSLDSLRITVTNIAQSKIDKGLKKACMIVETDAKNNCPKDMGILANSITHEVVGNVGYVYSTLPYAIYAELGTGQKAETNEGNLSGVGRQTPWWYFYTGKKLWPEEVPDLDPNIGKVGVWRLTIGMRGVHYLYNALNQNKQKIRDCFK